MTATTISFRVRYSETDQMGVVYHGKYADYLEVGRVDWLRGLGISYKEMEADGILLPVVHLRLDYKKSAKYDDLITVETTLCKTPSVRIAFDYKIHNEKGELLVQAHTVLVFMNARTKRPTRCPDYLLDRLVER